MKTKKKAPIGKIIAVVLILLVVLCVVNPGVIPFLTPAQEKFLSSFQNTYFTPYMPFQSEEGSFDPLRIAALILLMAECWVVNLVINFIATKMVMKNNHAETIKGLLCNLAKYAVVIYAIIFGLSIMGINMTAVIASLGVLGLIVGFGAQTLIEDVITGLFIIFEGQFHVGDIITLDDFRGTVTAIGIRTTQITDAGGNIKVVSNSTITTLVNLSEVQSKAVADISIAYHEDIRQAEAVLKELVQKLPEMYPDVFHETPKYVGVQALGASSVDLRVAAAVDEHDLYSARRLMNREMKLAMDDAGIEIPFNQVVVHYAKED